MFFTTEHDIKLTNRLGLYFMKIRRITKTSSARDVRVGVLPKTLQTCLLCERFKPTNAKFLFSTNILEYILSAFPLLFPPFFTFLYIV